MDTHKEAGSKNKRETILSRSKRIIGKQLSNDVKADRDTKDDKTTSKATQDDVSKRRAQILKAQRTHRRRTQNYIQELEKEVLRLRAREVELTQDLDSRSSVSGSRSRGPLTPSSSAESNQSRKRHDFVDVDLTGFGEMDPEFACTIGAAFTPRPQYRMPSLEPDVTAYLTGISIRDTGTCTGVVCGMDAQAAIDFILDLERPCLSHVKYDMVHQKLDPFKAPNFNFGVSHACTASASIIHSHQHMDLATQRIHVPVSEIESLLESSKSLPLGPEMTPVQVWAILVDISTHQSIANFLLITLKQELGKYMRCNSFGTTIEIDTLRQVLNYFFPWYSTARLHDVNVPTSEDIQKRMALAAGLGWEDYF